jgi:mannose-6-phosphate isomerase-like protein (cupin superfamily)
MVNKKPETELCTGIAGGVGAGSIAHLVAPDKLPAKAGLLANVTLEPGASVGYHKHEGEGELYYILSGIGEYTEDGVMTPVSAGMATYVYDGHSHGLVNTGKERMTFVAVIVKE